MIGLTIEQAKQGFFDRAAVLARMDKATLRALSKFGAFVRRRAKSSIRKRKRISDPGQPPSSHVGYVKDFLFFVAEPQLKNVVIGPAKLNGTKSTTALASLEHGGRSLVMRKGKARTILVRPRPFMKPAFDAELPQAAYLWQNGLR